MGTGVGAVAAVVSASVMASDPIIWAVVSERLWLRNPEWLKSAMGRKQTLAHAVERLIWRIYPDAHGRRVD